jgi:uncharacterized protein
MRSEVLVEGYASLFGVEDLTGDVVRAGAFAASLTRLGRGPPMLLDHAHGRLAGSWSVVREDGRGLYVRGLIDPHQPGGEVALARGLDGLSIGFRPVRWRERPGGRDLIELELIEVSLVADPALPGARFRVTERLRQAA